MTLERFHEDYTSVRDLIDFICEEELWDHFDYIITDDCMYDVIEDEISNFRDGWRDLRDYLNGIETGYDYYFHDPDQWFGFTPITEDDFERIQEDIEEYMDGDWDEEDEAEDDEEEYVEEDEPVVEEEPIFEIDDNDGMNLPQLFSICSENFQILCAEKAADGAMSETLPFGEGDESELEDFYVEMDDSFLDIEPPF